MKKTLFPFLLYLIIIALALGEVCAQTGKEQWEDVKVSLPKSHGSIYELLNNLSKRAGYMFIYDNSVVDNNQAADIEKGKYSIPQAVHRITGNPNLQLRLIGRHILIEAPGTPALQAVIKEDSLARFSIEGKLVDRYTSEPVAYATVGVIGNSTGTVSNGNGVFLLRLPDSLRRSRLGISHIGYVTYEAEICEMSDPAQEMMTIRLEPKVISIQEIVVRLVNPLRLLHEMLDKRGMNYADRPVYFTSFYREGIERKKGFVNLTEAVFKIYKSPLDAKSDQVKLLKMRHISNEEEKDTLVLKMQAGVNSCLLLDLARDLPDFLLPENEKQYNYIQSDITEIDNRRAYVVSFEQKKEVTDPLYSGELFIDAESDALLAARFEINPRFVEKATGMFVTRKSRNLRLTARKIAYTISYKPWNGRYYVNHIRGDLYFKLQKANRLFGTSVLHLWFEMATCNIESDSVSRFPSSETLRTRTIFADTRFAYDTRFWENFNIIFPEEELSEAIGKINGRVEEVGVSQND